MALLLSLWIWGFNSEVWNTETLDDPRIRQPVPVVNVFQSSWRYMAILRVAGRASNSLFWLSSIYSLLSSYLLVSSMVTLGWLPEYVLNMLDIDYTILRPALIIFSRLPEGFSHLFWTLYYQLGNPSSFHTLYLLAWKRKFPDHEVPVFVDTKQRSCIDFASNQDDSQILELLSMIYNMMRSEKGIMDFLGTKKLLRIEVIRLENDEPTGEVEHNIVVGTRGTVSRIAHLLENPGERKNRTEIKDCLINEIEGHALALNLVRTWDSYAMSVIIMIPTVLSLIVSIVWTIVAVKVYGADVQTSTQTSFSVASYIVTAGSLVIALVTFSDSSNVSR